MGVAISVFQALWFIWPAYCANAFPTVLKGKMPLDRGAKLGKTRLLGDSKTLEGTVGGVLFGIFIGLLQMNVHLYLPAGWGFFDFALAEIILLSVGALSGDIIGSFIKRRLNMAPGKPFLIMDQVGFLVAALILVSLAFVPPFDMVIILIVLTPAIHLIANMVGYVLKVKENPW